MSFGKFILQDSLSHLPASLQSLVDTLRSSGHNWALLRQSHLVKNTDDSVNGEKLKLLIMKGFFPFLLATPISRMKEITSFPDIEDFKNDLNEGISMANYLHAKKNLVNFQNKKFV